MKQTPSVVIAVLSCALALVSTACIAQVNGPTVTRVGGGGHRARVTPQQKSASDQNMSAGLAQLQAAATALQSGGGAAISDLQTAQTDMKQAMPIYRGYREKAIHSAERAIRAIQRNTKQSLSRAPGFISQAISDAQSALSNSNDAQD